MILLACTLAIMIATLVARLLATWLAATSPLTRPPRYAPPSPVTLSLAAAITTALAALIG